MLKVSNIEAEYIFSEDKEIKMFKKLEIKRIV